MKVIEIKVTFIIFFYTYKNRNKKNIKKIEIKFIKNLEIFSAKFFFRIVIKINKSIKGI